MWILNSRHSMRVDFFKNIYLKYVRGVIEFYLKLFVKINFYNFYNEFFKNFFLMGVILIFNEKFFYEIFIFANVHI
jgi:hypothetical protein